MNCVGRVFLGRDSPEKQRGRDGLMQQEWKHVHAVQTATTQRFEWNITTNVLFLCSEWGNYEFRTSGRSCNGPVFHLKKRRTTGITQMTRCFLLPDDAGVDEDINSKLQTQVSARGAVGKENKQPSTYILIPSLTSSRSPTWQVPQHHSITVPPHTCPNHLSLASKHLTFVHFPDHYFQEPEHLHLGHLWQLSVPKALSATDRTMTTINSPSSRLTFLPSVPTYWLTQSTKSPFLLHLIPITSLFLLDPSPWVCFSILPPSVVIFLCFNFQAERECSNMMTHQPFLSFCFIGFNFFQGCS